MFVKNFLTFFGIGFVWCPFHDGGRSSIFGIFYCFTNKRVKCSSRQAKIMWCVRCVDRTTRPNLVCKIAFRQFRSWECTTSWKPSWSWCVQNKVVGPYNLSNATVLRYTIKKSCLNHTKKKTKRNYFVNDPIF